MSNLTVYQGKLARRVADEIKSMPYADLDYLTPQTFYEVTQLDENSFDEVIDAAWDIYQRERGQLTTTVIHEHRFDPNRSLPVDHFGLLGFSELMKTILLALVAMTVIGTFLYGGQTRYIQVMPERSVNSVPR